VPESHHERAFAKLTRTLRVEGRRSDGYHLLRAEMVSLDLADGLEISEGSGLEIHDEVAWSNPDARRLHVMVPADGSNLVIRALQHVGRSAHVVLRKRIPHGGGLGGGSADAAAILRWAGRAEPSVAVELGADVPFCLRNGRALVTGVGEVIAPLADEALAFVLVTPDVVVSTPAVYAAFDELGVGDRAIAANDLERAALEVEPELVRVRDVLEEATGRRPQLAGSGSTFFIECTPAELTALGATARAAATAELGSAVVTESRTTGATVPA
jgi:4-diphosphocytidyl-2-C-methyl-D-erythritol kinase